MKFKEIAEVVVVVAGEDVLPLVKYLKGKSNVSEFILAEMIGQEINLTRNMLYRLYHHNLVSFIRRKDKTKGWYIYYWTFNENKVPFLSKLVKEKRVIMLSERLEREKTNQFFICKHKCIRLDFESAVNYEYKCPECGELLGIDDNSRTIEHLTDEVKRLSKELKEINIEVKFVKDKPEKKKVAKKKKISKKKKSKKKKIKKNKKNKDKKKTKKKTNTNTKIKNNKKITNSKNKYSKNKKIKTQKNNIKKTNTKNKIKNKHKTKNNKKISKKKVTKKSKK